MVKKNEEEAIKFPEKLDTAHVYILGAGATKALYLDLKNKDSVPEPPVMNDFIKKLDLGSIFQVHGYTPLSNNIEDIYNDIYTNNGDGKHGDMIAELEEKIWKYFSGFKLPDDEVTIYDKLICSLSPYDSVFTFNWDPFLIQALDRNRHLLKRGGPILRFLHGNVGVCYCDQCDKNLFKMINKKRTESETEGQLCRNCRTSVKAHQLLYPVEQKDYEQNEILKRDWQDFEKFLGNAQTVTIFGYGAPQTDTVAKSRLKEAWKKEKVVSPDLYIINTGEERVIKDRWQRLVNLDSYQYGRIFKDFNDEQNPILQYPRMWTKFFLGGYILAAPYLGQEILRDEELQRLKECYENTKSLTDYQKYIEYLENGLISFENDVKSGKKQEFFRP